MKCCNICEGEVSLVFLPNSKPFYACDTCRTDVEPVNVKESEFKPLDTIQMLRES